MGKFKKGICLGAMVGAGLMWLNATTKGKHTRTQILGHAERVYPEIKDRMMSSPAWKNMTKSKYVKVVKKHVDEYAKKVDLPPAVKNMIVKVVSAQWKNVKALTNKK